MPAVDALVDEAPPRRGPELDARNRGQDGAGILLKIDDASTVAATGNLAAHPGIAPASRSSGLSIGGEHPARTEPKARSTTPQGAA